MTIRTMFLSALVLVLVSMSSFANAQWQDNSGELFKDDSKNDTLILVGGVLLGVGAVWYFRSLSRSKNAPDALEFKLKGNHLNSATFSFGFAPVGVHSTVQGEIAFAASW